MFASTTLCTIIELASLGDLDLRDCALDVVDGLVDLCVCGGTDLELVVCIAVVEDGCICSADNTEEIVYAALVVD